MPLEMVNVHIQFERVYILIHTSKRVRSYILVSETQRQLCVDQRNYIINVRDDSTLNHLENYKDIAL